jgi:hypothetical protein
VVVSTFIFSLLLLSPVVSQTKTDRDRADLVGPVKSVEAYLVDFFMKDGRTVEGKRRPWHSTTYNPEGNISERVSYDSAGAITAKYIHTFDPQGRNNGYEEYVAILDKSLTIPRRHVYKLDDEGRRVEYTVFESNGSVGTRFVHDYDAKGNLIEELWYAHTGRLGGKSVSTFNEKGNQTAQANYSGDGTLNWKTVSKYDADGKRREWLQYQGETLRSKITSSYDSKGRIRETETFEFNVIPGLRPSHSPEPGKVVYTYDDEKRTKEVATYDISGMLKAKVAYSYDERGNEIGRTMFNGDTLSSRSLVKIEYDSLGNWTKKTSFNQSENGGLPQAYHAEVRVITYY